MPLAALISLAVTLIQNGPEWAAFVTQTVQLFEGGSLTDAQLASLWQNAVSASAAAENRWKSAIPTPTPAAPPAAS